MNTLDNREVGGVSDAQRRWAHWTLRLAPPLALAVGALAGWDLHLPGVPVEKVLEAAGRFGAALLPACSALAARRELSDVFALPSSSTFLLLASFLTQFSGSAARTHHRGHTVMFLVETVLFAALWLLSATSVWVFFRPPAQEAPASSP